MTNKFLLLTAAVAAAALLVAVAVVGLVDSQTPANDRPQPAHGPQTAAPTAVIINGPETENHLPVDSTPQEPATTFVQPLANPVNTSDLDALAQRVHLNNSDLANVDKGRWEKALPKARQLLQGACDCEERNWLNHFVETGNDAVTGATDYQQSAKLLLSLPKNDEEGMKHTASQ